MKTLKEHVIELSIKEGYDFDTKEELFETFEEVCIEDVVQISEPDRHRWYTLYDNIAKVKIDGVDRYFEYPVMDAHGDASRYDCGYEVPELDSLVEMYPKEVVTIKYIRKENI